MRHGVYQNSSEEQALQEFVAAKTAEFQFQQRIERMRWRSEVLAPAVAEYQAALTAGTAQRLELPDAS